MVVMMFSDLTQARRLPRVFFETTYDMFDDKADAEAAHEKAMELEKLASELEITVDYYIEEFCLDEF